VNSESPRHSTFTPNCSIRRTVIRTYGAEISSSATLTVNVSLANGAAMSKADRNWLDTLPLIATVPPRRPFALTRTGGQPFGAQLMSTPS
jgi:hypothetical protein